MECTSNSQEICGGLWKISVYDTMPSTTGYLGCFKDRNSHRTLHMLTTDLNPNSAQACSSFCLNNGYRYAGTEYSYECHCGNSIRGQATYITDCNDDCRNNDEEKCGDSNRISIYDTWQCAKQPCQHGGTCLDINAQYYTCSCYPQWTGDQCEREVTTTTTSTTSSTTTTELPTTADLVDIAGTTFDPNNTRLYEKQTEDQTVVTTYIAVACGVVVMVISIIVVLIIYRKRKTKASKEDVNALHNTETTNQTDYDEPNNLSVINVELPPHRTTLYDNEHVIMTADGEHVNIEFHTSQSMGDCDDYNTLSLSGNSASQGFERTTRQNQRANKGENTYSHLSEQTNELESSDTYSRVTRSRQKNKRNVCDSTYSHIGQTAATQSVVLENGMPPDGVYNTLNTLPKKTEKRKYFSNYKAISHDNGNQHCNIATTNHAKGVDIDDDNYSHVLDSKVAQLGPKEGIPTKNKTSHVDDNIYAQVDKKLNRKNAAENTKNDQSKPQSYEQEKEDENNDRNDYYYDDDNTYYNV